MERQDIFVVVGQALFAVFGAFAKWLGLKDVERQRTLVAEAMIAAFAGGLVFCMYAWLNFNVYLAFALAGIVGWLGAKGVDMLGKMIAKNSGLSGMDDLTDKDKEKEEKGV